MSQLGHREFKSQTTCDAIVQAVLYRHTILSHDLGSTVSEVGLGNVERGRGLLVKEVANLRTSLSKELKSTALTSPPHTGENGHLKISHITTIGLGHPRKRIDHRFIARRQDTLFPSQLSIVKLSHDSTDA